VPGQVLAASLRVWLRRALIKSTVALGFPGRNNQFGVCAQLSYQAACPAVTGIHGSPLAAIPGSSTPEPDDTAS
jgi:hypothetical protein